MDTRDDEETENLNYVILKESGISRSSREYTGYGKATYRFGDGKEEQFEGHYSNGVREGKGFYTYWNGETYKGDFHFNKKNGVGSATYKALPPDDEHGEWSNGLKCGFGRYKFASDKSELIGIWKQGRIKYAKWILSSGVYYVGSFERNKPSGKGAWLFPNGNQVVGDFVQIMVAEPPAEQLDAEDEREDDTVPPEEHHHVLGVEFVCKKCQTLRE